jgi:hypothetical protein
LAISLSNITPSHHSLTHPHSPRTTHQRKWEAVVLPAWDGSKTALARGGIWRFRPYKGLLIRNRHWKSPGRYHKNFPTTLPLTLTLTHHAHVRSTRRQLQRLLALLADDNVREREVGCVPALGDFPGQAVPAV